MKTALLFLLLTVTSVAWGQEIQHAPTAEQCRADIAVWKAESKADITSLSVKTLLHRSNYLSDCKQVLRDAQDRDEAQWSATVRAVYDQHIIGRAMHFIERNSLGYQFYDQDAKGAR